MPTRPLLDIDDARHEPPAKKESSEFPGHEPLNLRKKLHQLPPAIAIYAPRFNDASALHRQPRRAIISYRLPLLRRHLPFDSPIMPMTPQPSITDKLDVIIITSHERH